MKFYVLTNPADAGEPAVTDFLDVDPVKRGEAPECPSCGETIGLLPWLPPHRAQLEVWGSQYGDVAFGPGYELLISKRLADLYRREGLSGLAGFHEVEVVRVIRRGGSKLRTPVPPYCCVTVAYSRAAVDLEASQLILEKPCTCSECRGGFVVRTTRVVLEEDTWSGEDLFRPRGLRGIIMASERFTAFFERNHMNNGLLIDADHFSFDFYPENGSSGAVEEGDS